MVLALGVLVGEVPAEVEAGPSQPVGSYANPVITGATSNPFVVKAGSTFYGFVNGFNLFGDAWMVPFATSPDLGSWQVQGDVLPDGAPWADNSSGTNFSSPSMRVIPSNPAAQRHVLYFTAKRAGSPERCIGVATSASPNGPYTSTAQPLICPPGGAQDPSPSPLADTIPFQQVFYRQNGGSAPGIYGQVLAQNGLSFHPDFTTPLLLYRAMPAWWHSGVVDRPGVAFDPVTDRAYLFFSGAPGNTPSRAIGWSPCSSLGVVTECTQQTVLGPWFGATAQVSSPSGLQVFSDGTNQWIVYDGLPSGACGTTTCSGTRNMRVDKLCFSHDQPRTNGPTTGSQSLSRNGNCSTDIPGPATGFSVTAIEDPVGDPANPNDDPLVHGQPFNGFRDGGSSTPLNGGILWTYGDTLTCGTGITSTASLGVRDPRATGNGPPGPTWSWEPTSGTGRCPSQFIPFTAPEVSYNNNQQRAVDGKRIALWEGGGVPEADGSALLFFIKLVHDSDRDGEIPAGCDLSMPPCNEDGNNDGYADVGCSFCYEKLGTGIVRVVPGSPMAVAQRATAPVGCNSPDPALAATTARCVSTEWFGRPFVDRDPATGIDYVYGYSTAVLARIPRDQLQTPSAWRFWTDAAPPNTWSPDLADADPVPGLIDGTWTDTGAGAVAYNPYLDRYINLVGDTGFDRQRLMVQTASSPAGPWSPEVLVYDAAARQCPDAGSPGIFIQHAPLSQGGGRTIMVGYARPGPGFGWSATCPGQVREIVIRLA